MVILYPQSGNRGDNGVDPEMNSKKWELGCWLSRRQGLEKEAGLRRIPLQPAVCLYYNEINIKKSKKINDVN
jgi:hypothetical protein